MKATRSVFCVILGIDFMCRRGEMLADVCSVCPDDICVVMETKHSVNADEKQTFKIHSLCSQFWRLYECLELSFKSLIMYIYI